MSNDEQDPMEQMMAEHSMVSDDPAFKDPSITDEDPEPEESEETEVETHEDEGESEEEVEDGAQEEAEEDTEEEEDLVASDETEEEEDGPGDDEVERLRAENEKLQEAAAEAEELRKTAYARMKEIDNLRESRRQERLAREQQERQAEENNISDEERQMLEDPVVNFLSSKIDGLSQEYQQDKAQAEAMKRFGATVENISQEVSQQAEAFEAANPDFEDARQHVRKVVADYKLGPEAPQEARDLEAAQYEFNVSVYCLDNGLDAAEFVWDQAERWGFRPQGTDANGEDTSVDEGQPNEKVERAKRGLGTSRMQMSKVSGKRTNEFTREELAQNFSTEDLVRIFQQPGVYESLERTGKAKVPEEFLNR